MSDTIELPDGQHVPIQDTICECGHWYDEHAGADCESCDCVGFLADPEASTAAEIADRGGDPDLWPDHVKEAARA